MTLFDNENAGGDATPTGIPKQPHTQTNITDATPAVNDAFELFDNSGSVAEIGCHPNNAPDEFTPGPLDYWAPLSKVRNRAYRHQPLPAFPVFAEFSAEAVAWRYSPDGHKPVQNLLSNPARPYNAKQGVPGEFSTIAAAEAFAGRMPPGGGFGQRIPEGRFAIDLDGHYDPATSEFSALARALIEHADVYVEISPSGNSLRLLCRGEADHQGWNSLGVEVLAKGYCTITGHRVAGTPTTLRSGKRALAIVKGYVMQHLPPAEPAAPVAPAEPAMPADDATPLAPSPKGSPWAQLDDHMMTCIDDWFPVLFPEAYWSGGKLRVDSDNVIRWDRPDVPQILDEGISARLPDGELPGGLTDHGMKLTEAKRLDGKKDEGGRRPLALWTEFGVPESTWQNQSSGRIKRAAFLAACAAIEEDPARFGWEERQRDPSRFLDVPGDEAKAPASEASDDTFECLSDDDIERLPDPVYLVENVVPEGGSVWFVGQPGVKKSFAAGDMGRSMGYGLDSWLGHKLNVPPGHGVVYISDEGKSGLKPRTIAWRRARGMVGQKGQYRHIRHAVNLLDPDEAAKLIRTLRKVPYPIALLVVDTWSKATSGADENSARDMSRAEVTLRKIREALGCASLVLHHTAKDGRDVRGSSVLRGEADAVFRFDRQADGGVRMLNVKMRDAEDGRSVALAFDQVDVGGGRTSLVPRLMTEGEVAAKPKPSKPLTRDEQRLHSLVVGLVGSSPDRKAPEENVQAAFAASKPDARDPDRQFRRLRDGLVRKGAIVCTTRGTAPSFMLPPGADSYLDNEPEGEA